ncbi:SMI1/KNR4 family protein [Xanthomonas fragariae]|uniref:SMI1 / KNR4 family protein n=2 Tax=Xanthomonas fragariae TaxID=48664 RepID=A0A1Y6HK33_9XANT|nr:SMI1/KNR4 family protein [Xanthomonas fragariae]MBL9197828.1 SMI1/KNR4 family protein [Xanthomonas fragariae]MBL9219934.1 SMI1/KNR4 family protein [Xanthomonas fragariae]MDM7556280.1 SMI1/KNR4 family protein [Xanthomonas fragariae]MDM7559364.1 SMI1/KNR4 family protein [Xanthomonas fragariae]MDM7573957.1 SMI1/KNR4 family protein [Xanthomonas fragariae]
MKFRLGHAAASEGDVLSFEEQVGLKLPDDYRSFLLRHNGGRPEKNVLTLNGERWALNELYGLGDAAGLVDSLAACNDVLDGRIPRGFVAIGDTPGGDQFLLASQDSDAHGVYIFDHENEPETADIPWTEFPNLIFVADSFDQVLGMLSDE